MLIVLSGEEQAEMAWNFKIGTIAKIAGVAVVAGFVAVVAAGQLGLRDLKVGGPIYDKIIP